MAFLNAQYGMVVVGSNGAVNVFFMLALADAKTTDGFRLLRTRSHENQGTPIVGISVAQRQESLANLGEDGSIWVRPSTADRTLFKFQRESDPATAATLMLRPGMKACVWAQGVRLPKAGASRIGSERSPERNDDRRRGHWW
ncbi:MAG: hypothetical protein ACFCVA_03125 [Gammaproteobacteria bacterium]